MNRTVQIDGYWEVQFGTTRFDTGAATDADATPTYRVYEEGNDTVIASGDCAKRDDANTAGYYYARAQVTTAAGFEVGKRYFVRVAATVNSVAAADVVGDFVVVPAAVHNALVNGTDYLPADAVQVEGADATDAIRDALVDDATRIDASALNTLSGRAPASTIAAASDIPAASAVADAVWDEASTGHTDAGKAGAQVWTDIDAIAVDVAGLDGAAMRGTDSAALAATALSNVTWTDARAGYLDELGAANIPADIDTLLTRLSAARAGYLDKLNVTGTLAHSDAAASYMADVSALALEATLTAMKGGGWTVETLKAISDAIAALNDLSAAQVNAEVDTALADYDGPTKAEMDAGFLALVGADSDTLETLSDQIDAIAVGAAPTAGEVADAVWDEALAAHSGAGSAGQALSAAGGAADPLLNEVPGAYAEGSAGYILGTYLDAPVSTAGAGGGSNVVTLTVEDGDGDPVGSCPVRVANAGGQLLGYGLTNSATGVVVFNLDAGTYAVTLGPLSDYSPANPYALTVAGDTTETLTVTAISIPTPADPSLCVVYADMRNAAGGQLLGAGEGSLNVVAVNARPAGSTEVLADDADNDAPALTDGSGRAALSIVRGAVVKLRASWPDGHTKTVQLTVPDEDAYDVGADL